jgi:hypothetical protein
MWREWKDKERKWVQEGWLINVAYVWMQPLSTYLVSCLRNCLFNCVIYHEYPTKTTHTHTHWQLVMMLKCKDPCIKIIW